MVYRPNLDTFYLWRVKYQFNTVIASMAPSVQKVKSICMHVNRLKLR